jgi:alpha-1,6-mannosyltransferase
MEGHVDTVVVATDELESLPRPVAPPDDLSWRRLVRTALLGCLSTVSIIAGALLGGSAYETHLAGAWFFGMPGGPLGTLASSNGHPPIYAVILVYGGLLVLTRVWLGLLHQISAHRGFPVKKVVLVVVVWALPLLFAPPLFSRDVYSYAGQGEMVSHHINPYDYGTGVLGTTPFSSMPDSIWTNTPAPYGPTFLAVDGALAQASGHKILPDIVLLRLLELAGLALVVASTPSLARRFGRDPAQAVLVGAGCPLVLLTLIGGAHNEGLMLGLLLAGLAVAQRFGTAPGLVLCAAAAGVKSPAALAVLFLGWMWAGPGASIWRRVVHTLGAGLIAVATLEVISVVSDTSWGWLRTSTAANKSFTAVTPVNAISKGFAQVASVVHLHVTSHDARTVFTVIGLAVATAIGIRLLLRAPQYDISRNLGLTLLVVAICGPILWNWYVTWGVIVLAPTATGTLRRIVIAVSTFEIFVGASSVKNLVGTVANAGILPDLVLVAAIFALAIVPLAQFGRSRAPRSVRSAEIETEPETETNPTLATLQA